jgi:putative Holliday junction resolvase
VTEQAQTLLAFDYGEKHIGVAVGQTLTSTANPLESIRVTRPGSHWDAITRIVNAWRPNALIVGLPLNMDGSEQKVTQRARRFGKQLLGRYQLPVHLVDERLTTREARDRLAQAGRAGSDDHPVAAQIILESWLHEQRPSP